MKKPRARLQAHLEKRRKKALARRIRRKQEERAKNLRMEENKPTGLAPRWIRRRKDLEGLTYWRGARDILPNH